MSNKLRDIVYEIQYKLDLTLEQVAEKIDYAPTYLSKAMAKGVEGKLLATLKRVFADVLDKEDRKVSDQTKIEVFEELIPIIVTELAALKAEKTGDPIESIVMKIYKAAEEKKRNREAE